MGLGAALALQWLAGFPPFFLLSLLCAFGLACRQGKSCLRCFGQGLLWCAGLAAAGWIPFLEFLSRSVRGVLLSAESAVEYSLPVPQLLKELLLPQWYALSPDILGDPAIVAFYTGVPALILAAWGCGLGAREKWLGAGTLAALLLSLGANLPGYRQAPCLHVFRFPANWLLAASAGVAILCAAAIARLPGRSAGWLCAGLISLDLVLFAQPSRVAWARAGFLQDPPALARPLSAAPEPMRIWHTRRLRDVWTRGRLETEADYLLMRDYLAPSFGTAFGLQEVSSYQTLLLREAAQFQSRLAAAGPGSPLREAAGAALVVDIEEGADRVEGRSLRVRA
ncbi:MAG: hypothetical protein AABZ64_09365 [Nitrospinota bacterium]